MPLLAILNWLTLLTISSTYSTSPNYVTISAVLNKDKTYTQLVDRTQLPLLKQYRWHKFALPFTVSKYYKLVFQENYGDDQHIAVRQIRFLRSIESALRPLLCSSDSTCRLTVFLFFSFLFCGDQSRRRS